MHASGFGILGKDLGFYGPISVVVLLQHLAEPGFRRGSLGTVADGGCGIARGGLGRRES
jgi:hypothetical protein